MTQKKLIGVMILLYKTVIQSEYVVLIYLAKEGQKLTHPDT
jgi:hypothetical protein